MLITFNVTIEVDEEEDSESKEETFRSILSDMEEIVNSLGFDLYNSSWEKEG